MEYSTSNEILSSFRAPKESLGDLDSEAAAKLIAATADIALVIDSDGLITDVSLGSRELSEEGFAGWIGKPWIDTVTNESRAKIEDLLNDARSDAPHRERQVNHPSASGPDVPVRYTAIQFGNSGQLIAIGRDLRALAELQQKLVEAQQEMEREYTRLRNAETRYRLLFQIASEAVLIVDATASPRKIVEANPAAVELLSTTKDKLSGRDLGSVFSAKDMKAVDEMVATVRAGGHADDITVRLANQDGEFGLSASIFRQEGSVYCLIRIIPDVQHAAPADAKRTESKMLRLIEEMPDGFVVVGQDKRILMANTAFIEFAQLATAEQVVGEPLDRWLGRTSVDLDVLTANLRKHGSVRQFSTILRDEFGATEQVEVSAVSVMKDDKPCYGFSIRTSGRRRVNNVTSAVNFPKSAGQLTELIGRISMKEIVRDTTDMIERMCIESALELTGNNRASAAELLGMSRQSLYAKLHRYGLSDFEEDKSN